MIAIEVPPDKEPRPTRRSQASQRIPLLWAGGDGSFRGDMPDPKTAETWSQTATMEYVTRPGTVPFPVLSLAVIICSLFLATVCSAALSLPGHVYQLEDIDEAIEEAKGWAQPIAFVYTDLDCGCSLAESASYDAFRELKREMTIVYACSKNEWSELPAIVRTALKTPDSGKYIPKTVIVDAQIDRVLAIVPYIRNPAKRILALEEAIETATGSD